MSPDFDVCVVGSGAGGGPVAYALAEAGYRVVVLEKGPWWREKDFSKDEISECRRPAWTPRLHEEPHVVATRGADGGWSARTTEGSGWDFWNGVAVGGSTNRMSGFFLRLQPEDFRLLSEFGPVPGADVADWPIGYDDLEPWYARVESLVGVSGRLVDHPRRDRRSTEDLPLPPTLEHPFAERLDATALRLGLHAVPLPRAVLPQGWRGRKGCSYSGRCGSYACATRAKGSSRVAFVDPAVATGRCEVLPRATATRIETGPDGRATAVRYRDAEGALRRVDARVFVVACQAIETSRLLLLSAGPGHPRGLGNRHDQVGRRLLFSPYGVGRGDFPLDGMDAETAKAMRDPSYFVNRTFYDWYERRDPRTGRRSKAGVVDFLTLHANPIAGAMGVATRGRAGRAPLWGAELRRRLRRHFVETAHLKFEAFPDWMPMPSCRVTIDPQVRDRFGVAVARVAIEDHPAHHEATEFLCDRGAEVLRAAGAQDVRTSAEAFPSTNLQAGGCRFGRDPRTSVLDPDCRVHDADNVYVTDGSFMPTGGSVPYTFTIYANALRVADRIVSRLGGPRGR